MLIIKMIVNNLTLTTFELIDEGMLNVEYNVIKTQFNKQFKTLSRWEHRIISTQDSWVFVSGKNPGIVDELI